MPEEITFHSGVVLEQKSYAAVLRDGLKLFLQSSDAAPSTLHVPRYGPLSDWALNSSKALQNRSPSTLDIFG